MSGSSPFMLFFCPLSLSFILFLP